MTHQADCYRLGRMYLALGIVFTTVFLCMDIWSVYVAYWNIDGSFPHPKLHALVHGIFWSAWTLIGLWLIVAYFRERLFVNSELITQYGCVSLKKIRVPDVVHVGWKGIPHLGKIIVRSQSISIKIHLANYTRDQRRALIQFFSNNFPVGIQDGWEQFSKCRQPDRLPTKQDALRGALICALLLLGFGAILIYCWLYGLGLQFLVVGILTIVAGLWYLRRRSRYQPLIETGGEQSGAPEFPITRI